MSSGSLPYFVKGEVVKGFGRGSKELGCPTANFPKEIADSLPGDMEMGVYFGFANVDKGNVHKVATNIGWSPFYKNKEKSLETHVIHVFENDFYGKELRLVILGYLRPEMDFASVEGLIKQIHEDVENAKRKLDEPNFVKFKEHPFFKE